MRGFGIEIRRYGSAKGLYDDVDKILGMANIPSKGVNGDIQKITVAHSLQKMLTSQAYFDICTIKNCQQVCQIHIQKDRLDIYSSIHCMHWSEMLPDFKQTIVAMVLDDFREILNP